MNAILRPAHGEQPPIGAAQLISGRDTLHRTGEYSPLLTAERLAATDTRAAQGLRRYTAPGAGQAEPRPAFRSGRYGLHVKTAILNSYFVKAKTAGAATRSLLSSFTAGTGDEIRRAFFGALTQIRAKGVTTWRGSPLWHHERRCVLLKCE